MREDTRGASADRQEAPRGLAWLVWGLAALSFCFAYFQRVAPSVMIDQLMVDLAVGGALLGNLSALYFYAYAGMQVPAGMLLDRWGPRRVIAGAIAICGLGSLLCGVGTSAGMVYLGRLLVGLGAAFSFVGCLKLAGSWFPPHRFALISGLTMMVGMSGGVLGQAPLALVVDVAGWRGAFVGAGIFGLILAAAIALIVRDRADGAPPSSVPTSGPGMLTGLGRVARRPHNLVLALVAGSMSAPLLAFAGLWGVSWLMQVHGLARAEAALITSALLVGWAVGAPLAGWLSDVLRLRKAPLVASLAIGLATLLAVLYLPISSSWLFGFLFFVCGVTFGCMVLVYPIAAETNPEGLSGTAFAFCNMFTVGAGALFQPLIGALLDLWWDGTLRNGVPVYDSATYGWALSALPIFLVVGLFASFAVKETGARRMV